MVTKSNVIDREKNMENNNYFKDEKEAMRLVRTFFREQEVKKAKDILKEFLKWMYKAGYFIGWR